MKERKEFLVTVLLVVLAVVFFALGVFILRAPLDEAKPPEVTPGNPMPTVTQTAMQTDVPKETMAPTVEPTAVPTLEPTAIPTVVATEVPTAVPTLVVTWTPIPTATPAPVVTCTPIPTATPTPVVTCTPIPTATQAPTDIPTQVPTEVPTEAPTDIPTQVPTEVPTEAPTDVPTQVPTEVPTEIPTEVPTPEPTVAPTEVPTEVPAPEPTVEPTQVPTEVPTPEPAVEPTENPVDVGSENLSEFSKEIRKMCSGSEDILVDNKVGKRHDLYHWSLENVNQDELYDVLYNIFTSYIATWVPMDYSSGDLQTVLNSAVCPNCGRIKLEYTDGSSNMRSLLDSIDHATANQILYGYLEEYTAGSTTNRRNERYLLVCND